MLCFHEQYLFAAGFQKSRKKVSHLIHTFSSYEIDICHLKNISKGFDRYQFA